MGPEAVFFRAVRPSVRVYRPMRARADAATDHIAIDFELVELFG